MKTFVGALKNVVFAKKNKITKRPHHAIHWHNKKKLMDSFWNNEEMIKSGGVPLRYVKMASYAPGNKVFEIGSAEGVLALVLGLSKDEVYGLDINIARHEKALELKDIWGSQNTSFENVHFINGNWEDNLDIFRRVDTLIAARFVYHLQEDLHRFFSSIPANVENIMLVGNEKKVRAYEKFKNEQKEHSLGEYLYYASEEGMIDLLTRYNYEITDKNNKGDPIVIGKRQR